MDRYRTYGRNDDAPITDGDDSFVGVNEYDSPENLQPGQVQAAVNMDFTTQDAETRGGLVCLPTLAEYYAQDWALQTTPNSDDFLDVTYGNGLFVAVSATAARVMTSPDGVTWTLRTATYITSCCAYGNGVFVALGIAGAMYSNDGITWTAASGTALNGFRAVTYGNGRFVAVCTTGGATTDSVAVSTDGVTWTMHTGAANQQWWGVAYGDGRFVAVSQDGTHRAMYSDGTGTSWTLSTGDTNNVPWENIAYGNGVFVAVAAAGTWMYSGDGATWTYITGVVASRSITYGFDRFLAVAATSGSVMTSLDGISWTLDSVLLGTGFTFVTYGNSRFVAVRTSGTLLRAAMAIMPTTYATAIYSDPNDAGSQWTMLVNQNQVTFNSFGRHQRAVLFATGYLVTEQSTIVQCNNLVYIFRGSDETPLFWDGNWLGEFTAAPTSSLGPGFSSIPDSNQATYYQNRLWIKNGKDTIAASDLLDFTVYDDIANGFNLNTGSSDFLVTTYPFGTSTLIVFKNKSIIALQDVDGTLADVSATEITRQLGCIGLNAVVSVGPDLVYMSDRNINLLSLTSTNNAVQHKTLPLSRNIRNIFSRVNWNAASKVSMGYHDNKLYVALPLDNATSCGTVIVYNFQTDQWYGEWTFANMIHMKILGWVVGTYLGAQRMHCVTEDGRIFVTGEGANDISGEVVAEIEASLTTRAYRMNNENRINRRMWMDLGTWRPEFSVTAYSDGANEYEDILTDQTYSRSDSWLFNDSAYDEENSNDDYNRAARKDYSTGPDDVQCGSGFLPEMLQDYRYPVLTRRKGRLSWFKVTNSQGRIVIRGIGAEARSGDRNSLVQVI
jgi:hypothetical protein